MWICIWFNVKTVINSRHGCAPHSCDCHVRAVLFHRAGPYSSMLNDGKKTCLINVMSTNALINDSYNVVPPR